MTQEEIINCIAHVCAVIVVNANRSDSLLLERLLADRNRAVFVSTAIQISLQMGTQKQEVTKALKLQLKLSPQELADAINPKKNHVQEDAFVSSVQLQVQNQKRLLNKS